MKSFLHKLFGKKSARPRTHTLPLRLEALEDRIVPTFTYHGGPLLGSVAVQGLFLGSDWKNTAVGNPNPAPTSYFNSYLKYIVNSPYMDMLKTAGYQVGRGTYAPGVIDPITLTQGGGTYLQDSKIQSEIQKEITAGKLQSPGPNNLYVVFVEDNVPVQTGGGATSTSTFAGYHGMFVGTDSTGHTADIYYAVIPTPGGTVGNGYGAPYVTQAQEMTIAASHEIAEAATDPQVGFSPGWYDDLINGEIGDTVAGQYAFLNGYAVQRESDVNDQAMTPKGAAPIQPATFILESNGNLYERTGAGTTLVAGNVASISNQSIDIFGRAQVEYVDTSGDAWQADDGFTPGETWVGGVKQDVAAQGAEYVLLNNGQLYQSKYSSVFGWQWSVIGSNIASISGGSDRYGNACVDYVTNSGAAYEYSVSTGAHLIKSSGVASVSAGQLGTAGLVLTTGEGDYWQESNNHITVLAASGVKQVTVGTLANGNTLVERLDTNGNLWQYTTGVANAPTEINTSVASISNARLGVLDAIMSNGTLQEYNGTTWATIDSNTVIGVG